MFEFIYSKLASDKNINNDFKKQFKQKEQKKNA